MLHFKTADLNQQLKSQDSAINRNGLCNDYIGARIGSKQLACTVNAEIFSGGNASFESVGFVNATIHIDGGQLAGKNTLVKQTNSCVIGCANSQADRIVTIDRNELTGCAVFGNCGNTISDAGSLGVQISHFNSPCSVTSYFMISVF